MIMAILNNAVNVNAECPAREFTTLSLMASCMIQTSCAGNKMRTIALIAAMLLGMLALNGYTADAARTADLSKGEYEAVC
jgi:hypothetical protein